MNSFPSEEKNMSLMTAKIFFFIQTQEVAFYKVCESNMKLLKKECKSSHYSRKKVVLYMLIIRCLDCVNEFEQKKKLI